MSNVNTGDTAFVLISAALVCLMTPGSFDAVGSFYESFAQTTDEEVRDLLRRARKPERVVPFDSTGPWPAASRST